MTGSRVGSRRLLEPAGRAQPNPPADPAAPRPRDYAHAVVAASGTSFYWGMRLLPRARRDAMFAIYAFCREVDDIADDDRPSAARLADLAAWRAEVEALYAGQPRHPISLALVEPIARFDLPRGEFEAMIDGMEMDAAERMRAPSWAELQRYCRCVAGAVGLLSVRVFGARDGDAGARRLGEALQLTNILRDLAEDAGRGRLYLPRELLEQHGIEFAAAREALAHPALPAVCAAVAERAQVCFAETDRWLAGEERRRLRPARIMMQIYRRVLERLVARGWQRLDQPVRISGPERLWLALRYGLF